MYNLFGFLMGPPPSGGTDTVVALKHTVYAVAWLAVNQSVCITLHCIRMNDNSSSSLTQQRLSKSSGPKGFGMAKILENLP